jgi:hypothetical protein
LAAAGGLGLLLAGSARWAQQAPGEDSGLLLLRLTALTGALGLAHVLDDPARHTTVTSPLGRPLRTGLRLALVAPLAALWWTAALFLLPDPTRPPLGRTTLEAAAMATCALALATVTVRFTDGPKAGRPAAIWLGVAAALVALIPDRWGLTAAPWDPWGEATQLRWALVLGVTMLASTVYTAEPLRRRSVRHRRSGAFPVQ